MLRTAAQLLILLLITFTSCNQKKTKPANEETPPVAPFAIDVKQEAVNLTSFLNKFDKSSQVFTKSTNKTIKIKGRHGSVITINPAELETEDGQLVVGDVTIELKELLNRQKLLTADVQTISDGKLIVSGGAFYIDVKSQGKRVKLKKGKSYLAEFPKIANKEMELFYGQRDSVNQMNWKPVNQKFENKKSKEENLEAYNLTIASGNGNKDVVIPIENLTKKQKKDYKTELKTYLPIQLDRFGWINVDRFYTSEAPLTNLNYTISKTTKALKFASVYLVLESLNSIVKSTYSVDDKNPGNATFKNIPVGLSAKLLGIAYQNGKIYATLTNSFKVEGEHTIDLNFKEVSDKNFDKLLDKIN